jgi:hypothetical protein
VSDGVIRICNPVVADLVGADSSMIGEMPSQDTTILHGQQVPTSHCQCRITIFS